jgi:hypothetical protein
MTEHTRTLDLHCLTTSMTNTNASALAIAD